MFLLTCIIIEQGFSLPAALWLIRHAVQASLPKYMAFKCHNTVAHSILAGSSALCLQEGATE